MHSEAKGRGTQKIIELNERADVYISKDIGKFANAEQDTRHIKK